MQFLDEAKVWVEAGAGGSGCISFRRERHEPRGGPDGGDGGRGGDVVCVCEPGLNTLIDFRYAQHYRARKGRNGSGSKRTGARGKSVVLRLPVGTEIWDGDGKILLHDLLETGQSVTLMRGGKGGAGNTRFKRSTRVAPRIATPGGVTMGAWVWLKLRLLADVGLLGLPNVGKSTLLRSLSNAEARVGAYPFTTLEPQLGFVSDPREIDDDGFVLADIPGLARGAHEGVGLGRRFLAHLARCSILLHVVDAAEADVVESARAVDSELGLYSKKLSDREQIVVLSCADRIPASMRKQKGAELEAWYGEPVCVVSAHEGWGLDALRSRIRSSLQERSSVVPQTVSPISHRLHGV